MNNSSVTSVPEGCVSTQFFEFNPWGNENSLVPKEVDTFIKFLFLGICLPPLFIISFATNIISMLVFYEHGLKERINACLFTLSLVDLLSITTTLGVFCDVFYMFVIGQGDTLGPAFVFFVRNYMTGFYGLVTASQMVYSLIAVERCLCITRPLLVKSFMSTRTTVVMMWTMTLIVTGGFVLVGGVRYNVVCVFSPTDNTFSYITYPTDFYFRHQGILDVMFSIVYGLFFPGLSLFCVIVCTVVTAVKLKKLSQWRETVSSASGSVSSRDLAIARIIIGTSILFVICMLPAIATRSSFLIVPELRLGGSYDNLAWIFRRCYTLSAAINSTFNFFIYYAYGSKFRETTQRLLSSCYCNGNTRNRTTVYSNSKK